MTTMTTTATTCEVENLKGPIPIENDVDIVRFCRNQISLEIIKQ